MPAHSMQRRHSKLGRRLCIILLFILSGLHCSSFEGSRGDRSAKRSQICSRVAWRRPYWRGRAFATQVVLQCVGHGSPSVNAFVMPIAAAHSATCDWTSMNTFMMQALGDSLRERVLMVHPQCAQSEMRSHSLHAWLSCRAKTSLPKLKSPTGAFCATLFAPNRLRGCCEESMQLL